jgi:hypothetical protein
MPPRRSLLGVLVAGLACLALAPSALAAWPSSEVNDTMGNNSQCIPIRDNNVAAESWAFSGADTGYRFNSTRWGVRSGQTNPICPDNWVRIQQYPPITAGGKTLYFQRGWKGRTGQESQGIRHGHIHVSDIQYRPTEIPLSDSRVYPNSRACPETSTIYWNDPEGKASKGPIPDNLWTEAPASEDDGAKWNHYGDPPQTQGTLHLGHYNYLLWNWMWTSNTGGGQVRAILVKNETIRRCDVASISSPMFDVNRNVVGEVRGVYGKVSNTNGSVVYGWFVHSWRANGYNGGAWSYLVSGTQVP